MPFKSEERRKEYFKRYFRELKRWAVDKAGRKCRKCGLISEHDCLYDFHHKNGSSWNHQKDNSSSSKRIKEFLKWKRADSIPEDTFLLCANCHRLEHEIIS